MAPFDVAAAGVGRLVAPTLPHRTPALRRGGVQCGRKRPLEVQCQVVYIAQVGMGAGLSAAMRREMSTACVEAPAHALCAGSSATAAATALTAMPQISVAINIFKKIQELNRRIISRRLQQEVIFWPGCSHADSVGDQERYWALRSGQLTVAKNG